MKKISIIIPVNNENENILLIADALQKVITPLPYKYSITFVDDGSTDDTLAIVKQLSKIDPNIFFISLSRNFGHQNALKAGIDMSHADAVISMDGDMQHPPEFVPELLRLWESGNDIVYTIRKDRKELPMVRRKASNMFYNILNRLSNIELESGTADFRLMDKKVVDVLRNIKESDLFWRGIIKWMGFSQASIEYEPGTRIKGKSKYTYKKMIEFALRGITSFSTKPLTIAIYLGFVSSFIALLYIPYALYSLYFGHAISGWASLIVTVAFFGGLQLIILGIIGIYLGKLFMQSKQRPHYVVKESNII